MKRGPRLGCAGVLAAAALVALLAHAGGASPLQRILRDLIARTTPPGSESRAGAVERHGHGVETSWEVRTDKEWTAYREWVRGRLSDFSLTASGERSVSFGRWKGGDAQLLTIELASPGPPMVARVTLAVYPD